MDKTTLRSMARNTRNIFIQNNECKIPVQNEYRAMLNDRPVVSGYVAIGSEADPTLMLETARNSGCQIALPRVTSRKNAMTFHRADIDCALEEGPFGLMQPTMDAPQIIPYIILLPLLAFSRNGVRLGQGAGHYDRAMAELPNAIRIGIAWSVQEIAELQADSWDVPLHFVTTEKEWIII